MDSQLLREDSTITLPDGRTLAYAEYGDPAGQPIIFFHGTRNSRLFYPGLIMGVASSPRVIAFDRPGYGRSDFHTGWGLLECAQDVAHLADRLGIARFAVVGYSGGGPYAAACAYRWPARVTALGLVSSVAPLPGDRQGAPAPPAAEPGPDAQGDAARLRNWPAFLAEYEQRPADDPLAVLASLASIEPESGKRLLARPAVQAAFAALWPEGSRQGPRGWAWDDWTMRQPWGFAVEAITVPAYVWHGEQDQIVPIAQGRYLAAAIPGGQGRFYPNAGHVFSFDYWNDILATLVR